MQTIPRPEYPRPDFQRSQWLNLNGLWDFSFDDNRVGEAEGWQNNPSFNEKILVPYCYQSQLSGIADKGMHEVMWYHRTVTLPDAFAGKRVLLHFGAVDFQARVWVNGHQVAEHRGGHVPFCADITRSLVPGENHITLRAEDKYECIQPRGKQYWNAKNDRCWYTATSGIWQTVWMETVGELALDKVRITPDIDSKCARFEFHLDHAPEDATLELAVTYQGKPVRRMTIDLSHRIQSQTLDFREADYIDELHYWFPDRPNLYDTEITIRSKGVVTDHISTYFGMRKIEVCGDMIMLNNLPLTQKLILDQGYWPESLLTPPSDEAIVYDIRMTKEMGFNGARKHQKIEDPRYYYWADKMGLLVWGEMPSPYDYNTEQIANMTAEMISFINRDYNHPCIITWVPLNESWGVRNIYADKNQQDFGRAMYYTIKAMDPTRLISTNDGWEQVDSDICGIHDYEAWGKDFAVKYADKDELMKRSAIHSRMVYAKGVTYQGQPVMITEYGGIAFESENKENWGYQGAVRNEEEFFARYDDITSAIRNTPYMRGYCYTQLTDVMQEINGLLTEDRKPKVSVERVRQVNR